MENKQIYFTGGTQAVLLLHAYTGSPNDVRMLARRMEREGYTVLAPLFSGHGTQDPMYILHQHPNIWWQDAIEAKDFLKSEGYEKIIVFGLSLGGIYAIRLIEEFTEDVLGGGSFSSPLIAERNHDIFPNFLKYCELVYQKNGLSAVEIAEKLKAIDSPLRNQLHEIAIMTQRVTDQLSTIKYPIFLAQSGQDEMVDAKSVYDAASYLTNINHEVHWYADSTHVLTVSRNRKEFENDVIHFIEKIV
ncbi:alpha/beta hydrolase [Vagococcus vulneris]|uniref:alpha/beta hydrolase n=1 Tax=Vagococcus vulneris TaxID=1977869 RepID=UPI00140225D9|nr:alpha/beta fold hydrolase [Vagococcus vulneris]